MPENTIATEVAEVLLTCSDCSEEIARVDSVDYDNGVICTGCRDDHYGTCQSCEGLFNASDMTNCQDDNLCQRCYDENCYYCERCDQSYYSKNPCDCSDDRGSYESVEDRDTTELIIKNANTLGVEIEAEKGQWREMLGDLPKSAGIHCDGSLGNSGVEIVSPPMTMNILEDYIPVMCRALKVAGFEATASCGLHVHIEPNILGIGKIVKNGEAMTKTEKKAEVIKNIIRVFEAFEPVLYYMLPKSRQTGRWSKPLRENGDLLKNLDKVQVVKNFEAYLYDRYYGFNLCALSKYGTIEFRYHSGTMDSRKIIMWAKLLNELVEMGKKMTMEKWNCRGQYEKRIAKLNRIISMPTKRGRIEASKDLVYSRELTEYIDERTAKFASEHSRI